MLLDELHLALRRKFEAVGVENPALDARILMRQGGRFSDLDLIALGQTPLSNEQIEKIEQYAARRVMGEPVSRILGEREFWGMRFIVTPDTLDPRPDTETLITAALKRAPQDRPLRILDLGTGSGCILVALLKELPLATGVGIDLSMGAVMAARQNADALGVGARAAFLCGSWFEPLEDDQCFDLILSNPPYIPAGDIESLAVEVKNHDPILALSGGDDGVSAYNIILQDVKKHLVCGGRALLEIGRDQEKEVARLGYDSMMTHVESHSDLAGIVRVLELWCGEK